jgi:hypothetical protein
MADRKRSGKVVMDTEVVWIPTEDGEEIPMTPPKDEDEQRFDEFMNSDETFVLDPNPPKKKAKAKKKKPKAKKKGKKRSKKRFKKQVKVVYKKRKKKRESCVDLFLEDAYDILVGWWWD